MKRQFIIITTACIHWQAGRQADGDSSTEIRRCCAVQQSDILSRSDCSYCSRIFYFFFFLLSSVWFCNKTSKANKKKKKKKKSRWV